MRSKFKWIFTLIMAFSMQFSFAQEKTVTGVVSDELGPIAGANIVVQGTTRGAVTDFDGKYSISAKQNEVLVVSYVGKQDALVTVGAANAYNVSMQEGIVLVEVTVVGALGIKRKADAVTSSYTVVKAEEIAQAGSPNVVQGLVGKVSGLQINTVANGVNSSTRVVLNGSRSITGNNQALVVIDNVVSSISVLQSLPPEIIENVNVIKGAQGSALYGELGSNGVIVVSTIKGNKDGKMAVTFKSTMDLQDISYLPVRQTRYGQGWFGEHVAVENGGWGAEMDGSMQPVGLPQPDGSFIMAPYSPIKDNIKKFFQTGTLYQNGISISGGTAETGYALLSVNNQNREFVVKDDTYKRTNFLFKGGKQFGKWSIEGNVQYSSTKQSNTSTSLYGDLLQTATNIPVERFANGGNNHHWNIYYTNPNWVRDNVRFNSSNDFVSAISTVGYKFNKNISATWVGNVQVNSGDSDQHDNGFAAEDDLNNDYFGGRTYISSFFDTTTRSRAIYSDILLNFDYMLTDDISFQANIGNNITDSYSKINQVGGTDLDVDGFYNNTNVLAPSLATGLSNANFRTRKYAFFANLDFGYKDFLNLNLTGRNDNSSVLAKGNNSYFYPGLGLSFIPTKAFDAIKGNVLTYAKLYGSWTKTGNASNVGVYEIDEVGATATGYPYGDLNSIVANTSPTDKNIRPEFITTVDLGLSLGFFKDRLTFDGQYFVSKTEDMITRNSVSSASGLGFSKSNIGELENKGYNLDLGFTPIKGVDGSFEWSGKINYSHSKAIVKKVSDDTDEVSLGNGSSIIGVFATVGEEFPLIKGIGYQRDDQGRVIIDAATGNPLKTSEFIKLGKSTPDYIVGFTNSFSYKGVKLTAVMDYRTGHQFYSGTKAQMGWSGHLIESAENGRSGGFIFPNSSISDGAGGYVANTSTVTGGNSYASYQTYFSEEFVGNAENLVLDASAFKVRELALSYALPSKLIERAGLTDLSFGLNVRNAFMVLPKENRNYADPESSNTSGNSQGLSTTGQYPLSRTYGFTLNARF